MLAARVRLRANSYFWGVCWAVGVVGFLTINRPAGADETDPGNSTSGSHAARLEAEIDRLSAELASAKELLREASAGDDELRLAQRPGTPARPSDPPAKASDKPSTPDAAKEKSSDDKKLDNDAWNSLRDEVARQYWRPRGGPGPHPEMRFGMRDHGGPPGWAHDRGHGHGGPPWAHHRGHGHRGHGWAHHRHHHHGRHHHAHRHGHHGHRHHHGRGGPGGWSHHRGGPRDWNQHDRHGGPGPRGPGEFTRRAPGGFGPGPHGFGPGFRGDAMPQLARRLDLLEEKINTLIHEVRGTHDEPAHGGPKRDGPPHDGPPRDGPPRDGAPPRKPGD